ncbi:MAG: hypothetical protein R8M38_07670 [Mariprofundaceae bacterium]
MALDRYQEIINSPRDGKLEANATMALQGVVSYYGLIASMIVAPIAGTLMYQGLYSGKKPQE